jgi:hypothetical protein
MLQRMMPVLVLLASCSSEPKVPERFARHYTIKELAASEYGGGRTHEAVIASTDEDLLPGTLLVHHLAAADGASCLGVTRGAATLQMVDYDGDGAIDVYVSGTCSRDRTIWTRREGWTRTGQPLTDIEKERMLERGQQAFTTLKAVLGL